MEIQGDNLESISCLYYSFWYILYIATMAFAPPERVLAWPRLEMSPSVAIVKRIVELHRSQIAVSSKRDEGTQFSFWLPQPA